MGFAAVEGLTGNMTSKASMNLRLWTLTIAVFPRLIFSQATPITGPVTTMNPQPYQRAESCLPCHQRQYDELRSAVKSGYRNVSPLMTGLEVASTFLNGGLLRLV